MPGHGCPKSRFGMLVLDCLKPKGGREVKCGCLAATGYLQLLQQACWINWLAGTPQLEIEPGAGHKA